MRCNKVSTRGLTPDWKVLSNFISLFKVYGSGEEQKCIQSIYISVLSFTVGL